MSESVEQIVCAVVARELGVQARHVKPQTQLSLGDLGWKGFLLITIELERRLGIELPIEVPNTWTDVGDVILATEHAIAKSAAIVAQRKPAAA
jgi:acyl carrier protein